MFKRLCLILILFQSITFAETVDFSDISTNDWYYNYVITFTSKNILSGYEDLTFRPYNSISVEEFITLTVKTMDQLPIETESSHWADGFIAKGIHLNLILENEFENYSRPITRGEMSRIVLRASEVTYPSNHLEFGNMIRDFDTLDSYWQEIVSKTYSAGIITGYPDGTFRKDSTANRAEALAIMYKIYQPDSITKPVLDTVTIRINEIKQVYDSLDLQTVNSYYLITPDLLNFQAGKLIDSVYNNAEKMLSFFRYLSGLNGVITNNSANALSQKGALLIATSNFSHNPDQPIGMDQTLYSEALNATQTSNLAAGMSTVELAILRLMDDEDAYNISRVGHRRWFLYPYLYEFGVGFISKSEDIRHYYDYSVFKVFQDLEVQDHEYNYITWPSETAFPIDYMRDDLPWSLTLNPDIYDNSRIEDITVTLRHVNQNLNYSFNKTHTDVNGHFFNVETNGYGVPFCIIFRPTGITYNSNDTYEVTIENIYLLSGEQRTLKYNTQLFDLHN